MFTSSIAQLLTASYSPLSPATNIESLYIEKIKGQDVANNTLVVERRSVYKNFPIAIHNNPVIASFSDTDVISKTDPKLYNFPNHQIIKPDGNDIYVARFKEKHKISSSGKRLLGIDTVQYNLSVILSNYVTKSNFDASRNTFLNGSNSGFNNRYNALEGQITDINSSISNIKNNVSTLNATVLDKFLNGAIHTNGGVPYASVPVDMTSGEFYMYHYKPNQADNSNAFLCVCMAVDSTTVSSKVYMLPYVEGYCDPRYKTQQLEKWEIRMKQTNDTLEVIYMKDEKANEAEYDFKLTKTFRLLIGDNPVGKTLAYITANYSQDDFSLYSNCKNNIIKTKNNTSQFIFKIIVQPNPSQEDPNQQQVDVEVCNNIINGAYTGLIAYQCNIKNNIFNHSNVRISLIHNDQTIAPIGIENNIIGDNNYIDNVFNPNNILPTSYFYNNTIGSYNHIEPGYIVQSNNIKNNNTLITSGYFAHCNILNNNTYNIAGIAYSDIYNNCSISSISSMCNQTVFYDNNVSTLDNTNIQRCIFGPQTINNLPQAHTIEDNIYVDGSIYASDFYSVPLS